MCKGIVFRFEGARNAFIERATKLEEEKGDVISRHDHCVPAVTYFSHNDGYSLGTNEWRNQFLAGLKIVHGRQNIRLVSAPAAVITDHFRGTLPRRNGVEGTTKGQRATIEAEINRRPRTIAARENSQILHASGTRLSHCIPCTRKCVVSSITISL